MGTIKHEDFIQSVADGFQLIPYYHPVDLLSAMGQACEKKGFARGIVSIN